MYHIGRIRKAKSPSSRQDRYFGDPLPFNATIWHESLAYLKGDLITVDTLAQARMGRLNNSLAINPDFALSNLANAFSWGECASFFEILADGTTGTVEKRFIDYWLRESTTAAIKLRHA
jgi:hypothetical protein